MKASLARRNCSGSTVRTLDESRFTLVRAAEPYPRQARMSGCPIAAGRRFGCRQSPTPLDEPTRGGLIVYCAHHTHTTTAEGVCEKP